MILGAVMEGLDSLQVTIEEMGDKWDKKVVYLVGTNVEYAPFIEFGTSPHVITPNKNQSLKFSVGGETVFAKHVEHPGTRPYPYLRPAVEAAQRELPRLAAESDNVEELVLKTALFAEGAAKRKLTQNGNVETGNLRASIRTVRKQ